MRRLSFDGSLDDRGSLLAVMLFPDDETLRSQWFMVHKVLMLKVTRSLSTEKEPAIREELAGSGAQTRRTGALHTLEVLGGCPAGPDWFKLRVHVS
jgi:hypothetical protein